MSEIQCVVCKKSIPAGAHLCHYCSSFQLVWKNELRYWAGIVGLITFFGTLLVFCISKVPEIRRIFAWKDQVEVLQFEYPGQLTVANRGDGDLFLSHLFLSAKNRETRFTQTIRANTILDRGHLLSIKLDPLSESYDVVYKLNDSAWNRVWLHALPGRSDPCFVLQTWSVNDPSYLQVKDFYKEGFRSEPMEASLFFYSPKKGVMMHSSFSAETSVLVRGTQECKAALVEK